MDPRFRAAAAIFTSDPPPELLAFEAQKILKILQFAGASPSLEVTLLTTVTPSLLLCPYFKGGTS
jgi:hypothetical protein